MIMSFSTDQPLVSVLIATYNREKYIAQSIESVLASTYRNFELIIVDDCSKDKTLEIARRYAETDARVKVYLNEKNLGDYPNRNKTASYASGVYLKYVDDDDYIYPWGLELLVRMMEQFPDCGWGLCSLEQYVKKPFPFSLSPREAYEYQYEGPGLFHKAPLSAIIRRDVFLESGGFVEKRMVGDFEMWHKLALKYKVVLMPHGIVWSREHPEQEGKGVNRFMHVYEQIIVDYLTRPDCPLDKKTVARVLGRRKAGLTRLLVRDVIKLSSGQVKTDWKSLLTHYAK